MEERPAPFTVTHGTCSKCGHMYAQVTSGDICLCHSDKLEQEIEYLKGVIKELKAEKTKEENIKNVFERAEEVFKNAKPVEFPTQAWNNMMQKRLEEEKGKCSCQMRKDDNNK